MIKWVLGIASVLMIFSVCYIYIIPKQISTQQNIYVAANPKALERNLSNQNNWKKWWPGEIVYKNNDPNYVYQDKTYKIIEKQPGAVSISIESKSSTDSAILFFIPVGPDSILINCITKTNSDNPVKKILTYFDSKSLNKELQSILDAVHTYYSNPNNLYPIKIQYAKVLDSTLLFTSLESKSYPDYPVIYQNIDRLKKYALIHSAHITGHPMLNINTADSLNFKIKIALPVDKKLNSSGNISYKWMLGGGNILVTEITGGETKIKNALQDLEDYVKDHNLETPAIPFQSLITNRLTEQDSSLWITRIYYPVK